MEKINCGAVRRGQAPLLDRRKEAEAWRIDKLNAGNPRKDAIVADQ